MPYAMLVSLEIRAGSAQIGDTTRAVLVAAGHGEPGDIVAIPWDRFATHDECRENAAWALARLR
jgi:hypothetical protein